MAPTLPVKIERFQASLDDSNLATSQTIERMTRHIRDCAADPVVIAAARKALATFGAGQTGRRNAAWAVWWSIKHALSFVEDDQQLVGLTPNPPELELLISPSVMVRAQNPRGDCDDFTMLLCCFLEALGCPWEIVTVAVDPNELERWSHVYAVAVLEDGSRLALDASHGAYPGWEVPAEHVMRYQAWDRSGRPIARRPAARGLHGYRRDQRVGLRTVIQRGMRGLGDTYQCDEDGANCVTIPTETIHVDVPIPSCYASVGGQTCVDSAGNTTTTPAQSTGRAAAAPSFWAQEAASLANFWSQIGGKVVAPTTTYTTAGGATLTTPASSTAAAALLGGSTAGISNTTILLLVGGLALVFMLAKK